MKIQYYSDLHLEFPANHRHVYSKPIEAQAEILILAGDITYWKQSYWLDPFFDYISENWKQVYYVPGNHEYYNAQNAKYAKMEVDEPIRHNVHLINNKSILIGKTELFFTTLWSALPEDKGKLFEELISDFTYITYNEHTMTYRDYNRLHHFSLQWLKDKLIQSTAKCKIVVTHHVPSYICQSPIYIGDIKNEAFNNNLDQLIKDNDIDYWIYGHNHYNNREKQIGKTKLLTNQLGYQRYESLRLNPEPVIRIP